MQNFQLVRAAADVIRQYGWTSGVDSQGAAINARDERGHPVPLFLVPTEGTGRASINPAAVSFSIYGALGVAGAKAGQAPSSLVWETLRDMAAAATDVAHGGTNHVHPIYQYNEMPGRTQEDVLTFLELVAVALGAPPVRLVAGTPVTVGTILADTPMVRIGVDAAREKAIMDRVIDDLVRDGVEPVVGQMGFPKDTGTPQPVGPDDPRLPPMPYPGSRA